MAGALEIPSGAENLPECHTYGFLGPRISFSTDFGLLDSPPDHPQRGQQHIEWSTEFEFSLSIEQQPGSPADEIFSDGKLLPLQLLGPSSRIQLVRKLLEEEFSSAEQSRDSSFCPSPIITPGSEFPSNRAPGAAASSSIHKRRSSYSLKLVRLFRRSLGELGKSVDGEPQKSTVLFPGKKQEISPAGEGKGSNSSSFSTRKLSSSSVNSGRILWRNLERCSRSCAEQGRLRSSARRNSSEKNNLGPSFSSNVRVAPVLNVPICMGPVKEKSCGNSSGNSNSNGSGNSTGGSSSSSSTIAGLRKLLIGKKSFQRITWSCPGGTI